MRPAPALLLLAAFGVARAPAQIVFTAEPPPRLAFSNSSGARLRCAARGDPPPLLSWLGEGGAPLADIPALRGTLPNGTLWLGAFAPGQFRADVHAAVYRCRAASRAGAVLSRPVRVQAVMDTGWDAQAQATAGPGGAALLQCRLPADLRAHLSVTRWLRDGLPVDRSDEAYTVAGASGDLLVVAAPAQGSYSCEVRNELTHETKRSEPASIIHSNTAGSMAPRIVSASSEEEVLEGGDATLVCFAIGNPPPTYSWFRSVGGRLTPVGPSRRVRTRGPVLAVLAATADERGAWACRAHNALGEARRDMRLHVRSPLVVTVKPELQIADSGSSVWLNCSVSGEAGGAARVRWLHDGAAHRAHAAHEAHGAHGAHGAGARSLRVHSVQRAHRGMYQCVAERDAEQAQAAAELRLGDTAPELQYTFIEQALHPGPALALHCAALGTPPPRFVWLLDGQPLDDLAPHRTVSQWTSAAGDVVSYLNVSAARPEDGGRYTCRAANARGVAEHSTRLNVYGPPSIRSIGPVRVVAGINTTIYCPYSGFPISEIRWQRGGLAVDAAGVAGARAAAGSAGELLLWPADASDAGVYTCRVTAPSGLYAQKDVQIFVRNPPRISGFTFPSDLVEGSSVQALCGIMSGDQPVYFSWLKDGQNIPNSLQIQEKSLDEFSFLIFSHVTSKHSGEYTCVATNSAAEVNHTARLAVKVAPSWLFEPQDVSALLGTQIVAHCATKGYPEPRVIWLKGQGTEVGNFRPVSNLDLQFSVQANGSLSIAPAAHHHEGQYMCRAENGIGRGLAKIIRISVNEPAHFEYPSRNMSVKRTAAAALQCDARGDAPLTLHWTHNMKSIDFTTYRVSVSETRSEAGAHSALSVAHAERQDSGVYRCRAENAFGRDELLIYLAVQEFPESPRGLAVSGRGGRGATLRWRRGYDGNARLRAFRLQYRVVGERQRAERDDWADAPTREIPAERVVERLDVEDEEGEATLEYRVEGLRPATAYAMRIAAVNAIGESEYSDPIIVKTMEEAPSEAPHNVQVQASAPGELLVTWKPPPQESWNGELLGYVVTWGETGLAGAGGEGGVAGAGGGALAAAGWGAAAAQLPGLRANAHYDVTVQAFNAVGAGPASHTVTATTLEGVPEAPPQRVRCEALSSQSLRVWWDAPPARGGALLGYEVEFAEAAEGEEGEGEGGRRRASGPEAVLGALRRAGNYSLRVRARSAAGGGPQAGPVYCRTHEDVPGPPADIKALANSEDTIIVSWLPPLEPNGIIKHYTIYSRPQRSGQHSAQTVPARPHAGPGPRGQALALRGLREHTLYEVWVTAATAAGEGDMSAIVARKPNARAPAQISSFGGVMLARAGRAARLRCSAAGAPPPARTWARARAAPPLAQDPKFHLDGADLVILSVDRSTVDNYTCHVRNAWGEERLTWALQALQPPAAPRPRLTAASAASLQLAWDQPADNGATIHSYTLEYARTGSPVPPEWSRLRLPATAREATLARLACGARYQIRLRAHNAAGGSPLADDVFFNTKGGLSKAAQEKELVTTNSSCVRLNLLTWHSGGCPVDEFQVSARGLAAARWRSERVTSPARPVALCGLPPGGWFHLKVAAASSAGHTQANYYFSTLTESGERPPPPAVFPPPDGAPGAGAAMLGAAAALAAGCCLLLLGALAWRRRSAAKCFRKGYAPGSVSESEEDKKEDRDNRRNCQQVYTSSPGKHSAGKKDAQEMYEISPYATFSMAGGAAGAAGAAAAVRGATLRTFGREDAPLAAAAPPRPYKHASFSSADEYSLSRAMTLLVRRAESDSESSGSPSGGTPCAECTSNVSYRLPLAAVKASSVVSGGGAGETFRAATDSSAESADARSLAARSDKRRRHRRHHTPTGSRYQQRQEQERRDFTIHV